MVTNREPNNEREQRDPAIRRNARSGNFSDPAHESARSFYLVTEYLPSLFAGWPASCSFSWKVWLFEGPFIWWKKSKSKQYSRNRNKKGATMIEYALLVALIAIIALAAVRYLGNNVSKQFSNVSSLIRS